MSVAFSACASVDVLVWSGRPRPLPLTLTFASLPQKIESISDLDNIQNMTNFNRAGRP
jgi:hypothetical protein